MKKLLLLASFFWYLLPPLDTDLGWHLRYGQQIFQNQAVFKTNQIGFFLSNYQWTHAYSLYQLIVFTLFKFFGFWGLIITNALLMTTVFYFLLRRYQKKEFFLFFACIFLIAISHSTTNLGLRSQLFSFLGVSFLFDFLLSKNKFKNRAVFFLPLIFVFWANFHGAFVLGLALLFFGLIEKLFQKKKKQAFILAKIISLSFLATLINPFGLRLYAEIWRHTWYPLNQLIAEWVAPGKIGVLLIIISLSLTAIGFLSQKKNLQKKPFIFLTLTWLFFLFLSLRARRNLPLFGLASIHLWGHLFYELHPKTSKAMNMKTPPRWALTPRGWQQRTNQSYSSSTSEESPPLAGPPSEENNFAKKRKTRAITKIIAIALILIALAWRLISLPPIQFNWSNICQTSHWPLPCQAVEYLQKKPDLCPKIFNAYEWGGYLSWHLPQSKTFVDGRMPAWPTPEGKSPYTIYLEIIQGLSGFEEKLKKYNPSCLLLARGTGIDKKMESSNQYGWEKIYDDGLAVIYLPKSTN